MTNTPNTDEPALRLRAENLQIGYDKTAILPPLSFSVHAGEIWALFGPNGGGKSTLLRTILGLQPHVAGTLHRDEERVSAVLQRHTLDPLAPQRTLDVIQRGVGRGWSFLRPWLTAQERDTAQRAARDTQTKDLLQQPFSTLSEGQKQRVLIARALASNPHLLTLDEPTSAMDPFHERTMFDVLRHLSSARRLSLLIASHHMQGLTQHATHAIYVDRPCAVAIAGPFAEVAAHPTVREHYGDLFPGSSRQSTSANNA